MRFATIATALYAITGAMSAPVDQASPGTIGTASEGNVTVNVELVKTADGADGVRITYTTVDAEHPNKIAPPVTRLCGNIFSEFQTSTASEEGHGSSL